MKNFVLFFAVFLLALSCSKQTYIPGEQAHLADAVEVIPVENVLADSAWNIWCASMTRGFDGKYHLFYSRWPRQSGHESWVSHSEVGYAVAERPEGPEGPYRHVNVALPAYSDSAWDGAMTHNPYILAHEGKYYLYYIATSGQRLAADEVLAPYGTEWWTRRNTQRIGLAVANDPAGPWKRLAEPVLENSADTTAFDAICVTNPAVCIGRGGRVVMLYKGVCHNGQLQGGRVRFSVAFADRLEGPFEKTRELIFQPSDPDARMVAEDPFVWYDAKADRYFAIVRDVVRQFAGTDSGGLALMQSDDAIHWTTASFPKVLPAELRFSDGTCYDASRQPVERPFVYFDAKGKPAFLFGAIGINNRGIHREHSYNVCIPFKMK